MQIALIRHGKTAGNLEGRYIGRTDEPLCREGIEELQERKKQNQYPCCGWLGTSPMLRCRETASILYPGQEQHLLPGLQEMDFGTFEGKCYEELKGNLEYQRWLDTGGTIPFPGGEGKEDFCQRCTQAFLELIPYLTGFESAALVLHGGSIMAILERFLLPKKGFYEYQIKNGEGYQIFLDQTRWTKSANCCIVNLVGRKS